ncbi:TPA: minor capsid protein [Streptococcus pyogenes]
MAKVVVELGGIKRKVSPQALAKGKLIMNNQVMMSMNPYVPYRDGDGTEETTVVGVKGAYTFEGTYDPEDKAQAHIASLKYKLGDERKVWHLIVSADGKTQWLGVATVTEIIAGSGAAADFEAFGCKITYNSLPKESKEIIPKKNELSVAM